MVTSLAPLLFFSTGFSEATRLSRKLSALFESGQRLFDDSNSPAAKDSGTSESLSLAYMSEAYFQCLTAAMGVFKG